MIVVSRTNDINIMTAQKITTFCAVMMSQCHIRTQRPRISKDLLLSLLTSVSEIRERWRVLSDVGCGHRYAIRISPTSMVKKIVAYFFFLMLSRGHTGIRIQYVIGYNMALTENVTSPHVYNIQQMLLFHLSDKTARFETNLLLSTFIINILTKALQKIFHFL
jgi:hypothetical protein